MPICGHKEYNNSFTLFIGSLPAVCPTDLAQNYRFWRTKVLLPCLLTGGGGVASDFGFAEGCGR